MELPRYQPQDTKEREALNCLIPTQGDWENPQEFQGHVLGYLAFIREVYCEPKKRKTERSVQNLQRRATKIKNFAIWLESSKPKGVIIAVPSTSELLRYAERLSSLADVGAQQRRARRLHHSTHKETNLILRLLHFVREQTGKPHWKEMAILLKGATGDHGMNDRRLQALWNRRLKRGSWFRAAQRHDASSRPLGF
jgi:hypothetical protein